MSTSHTAPIGVDTRPLLTRDEVAALFKMRPRTIRQWTDDGRLPCVRLGRAVRYRPEDVERARAEGLPA